MGRYLTFDTRYIEQCEAGLIFWLIEELLDSQTVEGCRKVFDYLESRREINTAV
jgi:THO complex subunit 1